MPEGRRWNRRCHASRDQYPRSADRCARLQGLQLRRAADRRGLCVGRAPQPFHGFSIEFAEHREYAPGDDLRYLDWKVLGRTDKYYLKQFEEETNLVCHLLLDTSESMTYQSAAAADVEARIRQVRRRGPGLPGPAAAGQRGAGHLRPRDPRPGPRPAATPRTSSRLLHVLEHARRRAEDRHRRRSSTSWPSASRNAASSSCSATCSTTSTR